MTELERERRLLVGEAELLGLGPELDHLRGRHPGPDLVNRDVEVVAAALVGVDQRRGAAADGERPVVAGAVAVEGVQDVEVGRVPGAQRAVGEHVRVRAAALARDRVDALDELRPHVVEDLVDQRDALVLAEPGPHRPVELLVSGVDHHAGLVEQGDLVNGLDHPRLLQQLLAVDHLDPEPLQREQDRRLDRVDPERLAEQAPLLELGVDLLGDALGAPGGRVHRPAHGRDPGPRAAVAEPRVVELVMAGGGAEVPHDRLVVLRQEAEAVELVRGPGADVGRRDVADVRHVEAEQRPELRVGELLLRASEPLLAQAVEANPLLPVDAHRSVRAQSHRGASSVDRGCKRLQVTQSNSIRRRTASPGELVANDCRSLTTSQAIRYIGGRANDCRRPGGRRERSMEDGVTGRAARVDRHRAHGVQPGQPAARRRAEVSVYNRTRAKAEPLAERGATIVDSPRELAGCAIVFTMVAGPDDFKQVVLGPEGLLSDPRGPARRSSSTRRRSRPRPRPRCARRPPSATSPCSPRP